MDSVERWVSPDGQRIVLVDRNTGETWLARRVGVPEANDLMALIARWRDSSRSSKQSPARHLRAIPGEGGPPPPE